MVKVSSVLTRRSSNIGVFSRLLKDIYSAGLILYRFIGPMST